jgi:hypothetical protein
MRTLHLLAPMAEYKVNLDLLRNVKPTHCMLDEDTFCEASLESRHFCN